MKGRDYTKVKNNKFKNLFLIDYYPIFPGQKLEIIQLDDLGLVPEDSCYGGVDKRREQFEYYKSAIKRHAILFPSGEGTLVGFNNSWMFLIKAFNTEEALDRFFYILHKHYVNAVLEMGKQSKEDTPNV